MVLFDTNSLAIPPHSHKWTKRNICIPRNFFKNYTYKKRNEIIVCMWTVTFFILKTKFLNYVWKQTLNKQKNKESSHWKR